MEFLNHPETDRIIRQALQEDVGPGDYTSLATVPEGLSQRAKCIFKDEGMFAGIELAEKIFSIVDANLIFTPFVSDGTPMKYGDIAFYVEGDPRSILTAERLVLNLCQRMSAIATMTNQVVRELEGTNCRVLDTRKTTPLIRHIEKWAVAIGGGTNHRFGLFDMIMIKDNHIDYAGGIPEAIRACKAYLQKHGLNIPIEVETRDLQEVKQVLAEGGIKRIMLDNMSLPMMEEAVEMIGNQAETEASGGITLETVKAIAKTGVDFVSMGALTHSVKSMDISLKADLD